jgi:hypothetical protein
VKNEVRFQRKLNSASAQCKRVWYITEKPGTHINLFRFISFPFVIAEGAAGAMPPWLKPVLRRTLDRRRSSGEEQL